jgi:hypothetical protein
MNMFAVPTEEDAHEQHGALNLNVEASKEGAAKQMDYLFSDLVDPYLGLDYQRFPHADSVVPSGAGAVPIVELDFACGLAANANAKPPTSYSSYTATTSLAHSVSSLSSSFVLRSASCMLHTRIR